MSRNSLIVLGILILLFSAGVYMLIVYTNSSVATNSPCDSEKEIVGKPTLFCFLYLKNVRMKADAIHVRARGGSVVKKDGRIMLQTHIPINGFFNLSVSYPLLIQNENSRFSVCTLHSSYFKDGYDCKLVPLKNLIGKADKNTVAGYNLYNVSFPNPQKTDCRGYQKTYFSLFRDRKKLFDALLVFFIPKQCFPPVASLYTVSQ